MHPKNYSLKKISLPLILFTLIFWVQGAAAEVPLSKPINIVGSYSSIANSYNLYENGLFRCSNSSPVFENVWGCTITIDGSGNPVVFTMTAVDDSGTETPHSAPYSVPTPILDTNDPGNLLPMINLDVTAISEAEFRFDASASRDIDPGGSIINYHWEFGDGDIADTDTGIINHTYLSDADYTVTLTVTDNDLGEASESFIVSIITTPDPNNQPPNALIDATVLDANTSTIAFDATGSTDPDGDETIIGYTWNFGDGSQSQIGDYVEHEFTYAGTFTVTLTVRDAAGAEDTDQFEIVVTDAPPAPNNLPEAVISASTTQKQIELMWEYPSDVVGLAGFRFYQNGYPACEVADPNARQMNCTTFLESGVIQFALTAFFTDSSETTESEVLSFDATSLVSNTLEAVVNEPVLFNGLKSTDSDGTIASYEWNLGDGTFITDAVFEYAYATAGEYTVTLTVTDDSGDTATFSQLVPVNPTSAIPLLENDMDQRQFGYRWGTITTHDKLTTSFQNNGNDRVLHAKGFDIDISDEIGVYLNGNLLGYLTGANETLGPECQFLIPLALQNDGQNLVEFIQISPGWKWGVTSFGIFDGSSLLLLENNLDENQYGYRWGTILAHDKLTTSFQNNGNDRVLHAKGFDIDISDEIGVYLNGNLLGYLTGANETLGPDCQFLIPLALQNDGENLIEFIQISPGWKWGVTSFGIFDGSSLLLLENNLDENQYGYRWGTILAHDKLTTSFQNNGNDRVLHAKGFDIDISDEIGVYLNGNLLGYLTGANETLGPECQFTIPLALQNDGENLIEFIQKNLGWKWGVTSFGIFDPGH